MIYFYRLVLLIFILYRIVFKLYHLSLASLNEDQLWLSRQIRTFICGQLKEYIVVDPVHGLLGKDRAVVLSVGEDEDGEGRELVRLL